ncbi:glycoside hydrolase family 43 protein [Devosia sp. RR2S18]|uniref:glycoside hydrolase family 43 protein n=1 Tax=Devosia rhizosphaerae TaxID=3049774 RepID=UPI0025406110|nr:glycoside hydrolase family 43 protein [Devosia sp. RR2S18]WIJ25954.1 glycoside hydrolase family 43 protein [Devosia sp. RR2S18]
MPRVTNPILPGFNPDPSIVRVGEDYFIATSTFEWYPGVQIHHSRDLANWKLVTRPLDRPSLLDMRGDPDSGGIWAPDLTYADGQFWLVYTDVKRQQGSYKDVFNYVTTAPAITGPWSEPVYLNATGFDPALFHEDDGKKYLLNMIWDHRGRPNIFAGIALQEYDPATGELVGEEHNIFQGTDLGLVEGPHLYKRNGWYYLLTAEGGTGFGHACTLARSRNLLGPYELHPDQHILTTKDEPLHPMQRAGHGDIAETPDGVPYLVHLMSRPVTQKHRSILGRETSIQRCEWRDDDWLYVVDGPLPAMETEVPGTPEPQPGETVYRFSADAPLPSDFQWLRTPVPERIFSLTERPGALRLFGRQSIGSWFEQALVARRQTDFDIEVTTTLEFSPRNEREMAGLTIYYGRHAFVYLHVSAHSDGQRELLLKGAMADNRGGHLKYLSDPISIPNAGPVHLALRMQNARLQFFYSLGSSDDVIKIGPELDGSILSDEASVAVGGGSFTGTFVGMAAQDLNGKGRPADFLEFTYRRG